MHALALERGRHLGMEEEVEGVEAEPVSPPAEACRACWWRWRWVHEAAGINGRRRRRTAADAQRIERDPDLWVFGVIYNLEGSTGGVISLAGKICF